MESASNVFKYADGSCVVQTASMDIHVRPDKSWVYHIYQKSYSPCAMVLDQCNVIHVWQNGRHTQVKLADYQLNSILPAMPGALAHGMFKPEPTHHRASAFAATSDIDSLDSLVHSDPFGIVSFLDL